MNRLYAPMKALTDWATEDPVGQAVALGAAVLAALLGLFFVLRTLRWAFTNWKAVFGVALALGAGYYAAMMLLDAGPTAWVVAGLVVFGAFVGFALAMAGQGKR